MRLLTDEQWAPLVWPEFVLPPESVGPDFGLPSRPPGDGGGSLIVKGTRGAS
ncbi:hypothetical protein [Streptomyces tendae]|uniref:hypothetical protein n=1 Tax=Streptomyces tendae TaxID=1932 RepID=UPI0036C267CD